MTTTSEAVVLPARRRLATPLELGLLGFALAALAFGAGAVGWTIGHGTTATRTVTVVAKAPAGGGATAVPAGPKGDAAAGKAVFVNSGCGSCHVLAAIGAKGTVGPNLDQVKLTEAEILVWVGKGKGAMPSFGRQLTAKQVADVSAFLAQTERK